MSVQAISWVLEHSDTQGAERLVLLSIANHAGPLEDGVFAAWPGIDVIAEEARIDRLRTVTNTITRLHKEGVLERVVNGAPDDRIPQHRRPNLYRILTEPRTLDEQIAAGRVPAESAARHPMFRFAQRSLDQHAAETTGVSDTDTPSPVDNPDMGCRELTPQAGEWGVAIRRDGVSDTDAMGCHFATPKPSVNRHRTEHADVSRADPPPDPAVENPAATADQRRARIAAACRLLAERRATARPDVGPGWITATARALETDHASAGHGFLVDQPDLAACELADRLEPDPARQAAENARAQARAAEAATRARNDRLRNIQPASLVEIDRRRGAFDRARQELAANRTGPGSR